MQTLLRKYYQEFIHKITAENVCQVSIILTGATQAWLFTRADIELSTIGCVVGLIGVPAWLYTSYKNKQFGISLIALWYAFCFIDGLMK